MLPELTNLLPEERLVLLRRDYLFRLGTLVLIFVSGLILAHAALLAPSYVYVINEREVEERRATELSEEREQSGFADISARIAMFSDRAASIKELQEVPAASDLIREVLLVTRRGASISSFVYGAQEGKLLISGTAPTRESLRDFVTALAAVPFVRSTDLPLSAYAKESDIPFSITLVLDTTTP